MYNRLIAYIIFVIVCSLHTIRAAERTVLIGPKTIGKGWKDQIVLEPRHFTDCKSGDVLTVYNDNAKRTAQGAFQDPLDWKGISDEYNYFSINGPFRLVFTDEILDKARQRGIAIAGHDYRIVQVTISAAEDYEERIIWRGPSVLMKPDWSVSAEIPAKNLDSVRVGDGLRLHISSVQSDAAMKIMDFTWNAIEPSMDGVSLNGDSYTWYIYDNAPLLKIQLAGGGMNTAMRVGGKGYRLNKIGVVRFIGTVSDDYSKAQRAPKEYVLQPGELFHGEKYFPCDWSGNLRINAAAFQKATLNDVLVISYTLDSEAKAKGITPQLSLRESKGWSEITGAAEPVWYPLDGTDVVYLFDTTALDQVKTRGFVLTGIGFMLNRIELISAQ